MPELTPRGSAACKLFWVIFNERVEQCSPEESTKLRLAINPEHMSHEIQVLMAEAIGSIIAVTEANATAFANHVVMGDDFAGFNCDDFVEEDE